MHHASMCILLMHIAYVVTYVIYVILEEKIKNNQGKHEIT